MYLEEPGEPIEAQDEQVQDAPAPEAEKPDKVAGKSNEELVKMLKDQEKILGKWANEIGEVRRLKDELAGIRDSFRYAPPQGAQPRQEEQPPGIDDTEFLTRPSDAVRKVVRTEIGQMEQARKAQEWQRYQQDSLNAYNAGRTAAAKGNERLFEGIENDVAQTLFEGFRRGIADPNVLRDPATHINIARTIRINRDEWDKVIPPTRKAAPLTPTETPGGARRQEMPEGEEIQMDEDARAWAKSEGIDEKTAMKRIQQGVKARRGRIVKGT